MEARRRDESKQDYKKRMGLITKEIEVKPRVVKAKKETKKED